jgi:hypothetical protein
VTTTTTYPGAAVYPGAALFPGWIDSTTPPEPEGPAYGGGSRTGVGCRVLIDGQQLDDGCIDWAAPPDDTLPQALSANEGLKITWGRSTTVEQPATSTCTFVVTDSGDGVYFHSFGIGSSVEVLADALITGGATVPAFTDPDFETELRAITSNAVATRDSRHVETGALAAVLKPLNADTAYGVQLPPGTIQQPGTNPNAWDGIPHLGAGQTWEMSVRVWAPQGVTVTARALVYSGPYAAAAVVGQLLGSATGAVGGSWATIGPVAVAPGVTGGWLGVQLTGTGGAAWRDVPDTWTWAAGPPDTLEWRDFSDIYIDRVTILAPPGGTVTTILVFGGRVTDLESLWGAGLPQVAVTAADFLGDLGNRFVGDEPWLAEPLETRMRRVLALASASGELPITAEIATTLAPVQLSWEDVDHRAASGLLTDMADSVDGVLWSATHLVAGPYVKLEDPAQRPPLYQLGMLGGKIVILPIDPDTLPAEQQPLDISACDVLRDPVRFVLDVSDIGTRATITWQEQTLDDDGLPAPTERTLATIDANREAAYGTRNISVQTMLTSAAAAQLVADRLLSRATGQWRMDGLLIADADFMVPDATAAGILLTLLDGVRRGGMAVRVTDLPSWSPLGQVAPAYVEGGEYRFVGGGWELALTISRATGLGQNAAWDELPPTWRWDDWAPQLTWDSLRGVAAP